ncbi:hypothetical protein LTR66_001557 [Elasticomyces elasticus]|nr:hypothetical protein LTR66_001557 [Elasticomyces elasticus]
MSLAELGRTKSEEAAWEDVRQPLQEMATLLKETKGPYFMGSEDFVFVSYLQFLRRIGQDLFDRTVSYDQSFYDEYSACEKYLARDST